MEGEQPDLDEYLLAFGRARDRMSELPSERMRGAFAGAALVQEVFGAAAGLLRAVEDVRATTSHPLDVDLGEVNDAAERLRAAFDEWLPGWDSEPDSASAN